MLDLSQPERLEGRRDRGRLATRIGVSMKRWILAAALGASLVASPAWARKGGNAKAEKDDDDPADKDDDKKKPDKKADAKKADAKKADAKKADAKKAAPKKGAGGEESDEEESDDDEGGGFKGSTKSVTKETGETPMVKQDLNGHDMG